MFYSVSLFFAGSRRRGRRCEWLIVRSRLLITLCKNCEMLLQDNSTSTGKDGEKDKAASTGKDGEKNNATSTKDGKHCKIQRAFCKLVRN